MSCDINYIRYLTRTCRLFADEHSLSFSLKSKKMSSVGVLRKKNLSVLWEKKNLSVRRKIFKVWRKKKCKCGISGVRKKNWKLKEKFREKKSKCFVVEILLSSYSLAGLYVNLHVKVTGKKCWKFSKYLKLKLRLQRKFKIRDFCLLGSYPLGGRHVDWKFNHMG